MELITSSWSWYVAGTLIGLTVPTLLLIGNKQFGISSSLRHICAACIPAKIPFFNYDWKKEAWNLFFVVGVFLGGFIASYFLQSATPPDYNATMVADLQAKGIQDFSSLMPADIFSWENLLSLRGFVFIILGGFLVGFGTRYAGGCTSGHAIMGLSNLQLPSLIATICFMVGGMLVSNFVLPYFL